MVVGSLPLGGPENLSKHSSNLMPGFHFDISTSISGIKVMRTPTTQA